MKKDVSMGPTVGVVSDKSNQSKSQKKFVKYPGQRVTTNGNQLVALHTEAQKRILAKYDKGDIPKEEFFGKTRDLLEREKQEIKNAVKK